MCCCFDCLWNQCIESWSCAILDLCFSLAISLFCSLDLLWTFPPTLSLPFLLSFLPADILTDLKKEDSFSNWSIFELRLEQIGYDESQ